MFRSLLVAAIMLGTFPASATEDSLLVMFWNLENFFDWKRDTSAGNVSDEEFSSFGKRHWTKRKFQTKCRAVAKAVYWIADTEGRLPDAIGVAEVENRFVLKRLLEDTSLDKAGYGIVHYDSPDPRGIDVALLYRKSTLEPLESMPIKVNNRDGPAIVTRDILLARFQRTGGQEITFLVNHHPSKYGENSGWRREAALKKLEEITDSLTAAGHRDIVAMGDFNDTPESTERYSRKMTNLAMPLSRKGEGTIKYEGRWEMIDMFFISPSLAERLPEAGMKVARVPFLMVRDNAHSGEKPLRTYLGPRYAGGVSDHCPITLVIQ